ncbi:Protein FMP52, mitochondrial [Sphaceloma murrayae]|uniref:Protein FMP52, mitochondrial n=1 Tax=Sphaceloma murrayae TaxID=2082308 RepID=A0A2K1QRE7_9PEZI|nr:Protein FMP52, mitochondrial [Sphaceloma murrayae]
MGVDTALAGGTGLVGSNILTTLGQHSVVDSIYAFGRRDFPQENVAAFSTKLKPLVSPESSQWPSVLSANLRGIQSHFLFFSALGTTRAQAGGLEYQRKIDHELPVNLAKALIAEKPESAGGKKSVFVLISSAGANPHSFLAYPKMKGETEEEIKGLLKSENNQHGLDHVVILRPGLIVGTRREQDSRPAEWLLRKVATFAGSLLGNTFKDFWAQDADVIAKAAVSAALLCSEGQHQEPVWVLGQSDIVRLGRTEWNKSR